MANRDLQRGQAVRLASGEAVARHLGVPPLTAAQLGLAEFRFVDPGWQPTLSGRRAGSFGLADILVPPR